MRTLFLFHKTGTALFIRASRAWGLLVLLLSAPLLGLSQSLVTYPVNAIRANDNTNTTLAPTGVNPNIIASPIRLNFNPNYFDPATPNTFTSGPQSDQGFFAMYQFTNANAYDPNSTQYLEFTISPRPGFLLNIPTILLTLRGKPNGPDSFDFRASLNNFDRTGPVATSDVLLNTYLGTSVNNGITKTSTLPAVFLNTTKTITFRAYGYNASNVGKFDGDKPGGIYKNSDGSNFSISGTAPPRPAAVTDVAITAPGTPVTFAVTTNDVVNLDPANIDLDPATPGVQSTFTVPGQGTFTTSGVTAGSVQFTPAAGFTGTAVIPYVDTQLGSGTLASPANLVVTVRPPAPADLATSITASAATVNAGAPITFNVVGRNLSGTAAANVQETLQLPVGIPATGFTANGMAITSNANGVYTFVDGTTYNAATGVVTFPVLSTLAGNAIQNYSVTFNAPGSGPFTATAYVGNGSVDPTPANNVASAVVTIGNPAFDVTTQLLGPASTTAGNLVTYVVLTGNNGPSLASAAVQTVQLPVNLTGVFATNGGVYDPLTGMVTFAAVPLAAGKSVTNTVSFTAPAVAYAASAAVTPNTIVAGDTNPANNTAFLNGAPTSTATTVNPASGSATNLYVTVTGPAVVTPGQTGVTYTVTEGNKGPVAAAAVVTVVSLPTGLDPTTLALNGAIGSFNATTGLVTFGAGSGNGSSATYDANTGVLALPTLASQAVANVQTYAVSLTAPLIGPSYPVVATVRTTTPETVAADNVAIVVTEESAFVDVATVISGPATTIAGQNVTYAVNTLNNSSFSANSVIQAVSIPAGIRSGLLVNGAAPTATTAAGVQTFTNGASYDPATGLLTFATLTVLAGGSAVENTYTYPAPGALALLTNVASVSTASADGLQANNTSTALTTVSPVGDVTVNVSGPAVAVFGSLVTYEVTTTNNGPAATDQTTTAQLPAGLSGVLVRDAAGNLLANTATTGYNSADGVVRFPTATALAPGVTNALTGLIQVPMPDAARLVVTAVTSVPAGALDTNLENNVSTVATTGGSPISKALDLQVAIAANLTTQTVGQPVTFTVTTTNNSATVAANNVTQTVALPTGLTGVKVNGAAPASTDAAGVQTFATGATYNPNTGVLTLPALATLAPSGVASTLVTVNAPGEVTVNATGQKVFAATAVVATDNAETTVANNTATAQVVLIDAAEVATLLTGPATTAAGNAVTYTVVTSNNGPAPAAGLVQTVTIPANASASTPVVSGGGTVAAGGSPTAGYTVTFPAYTAEVGSSQTNTVSFTAGTLASYTLTATVPTTNDPNTANNTSTFTTTEPNRPPVANDVVNSLQAPESNTAGQLLISPLVANDPDGTIARYNLTSIPPMAQGTLLYNAGTASAPNYVAFTPLTNLAALNLSPAQAQTLRFDPAATFVGTVSFLYTATDNTGAVSNTAQYTIPVGQDINSAYTATPVKGGNANPYQNGDALAYGIDPNGAAYNASGLVYNANGTPAAGTPSSGLASASISSADLTTLAANGIGFDPTTGLFTVTDRTKLPRTATSFTVTVTTTDVLGGVNTQPFTFSTGVNPLPVELKEFVVTAVKNADAALTWTTASEKNNDHFAVERSFNGADFAAIAQIKGKGTSTAETAYALTDVGVGRKVAGAVYYRLKQVDTDGTASYSPVRTVAFTAELTAPSIHLAPNPATTATQLELTALPAGQYQVSIVDLVGRTVYIATRAAGTRPTLDLHLLPAGSYVVVVRGQSLRLTTRLMKE